MTDPLSLDALFAALRNAGLQVGVSEVLRLQRVFALQPDLLTGAHADTRRRLKAVLRAVLVNSREDRPAFERAYDAWLALAEQEIELLSPPPSPPKPMPEPPRRWWHSAVAMAQQHRRMLSTAAAVMVLIFAAIAVYKYYNRSITLEECDLCLMDASDSNPDGAIIRKFQMEFESKKTECAVLIVRVTRDSEKWTIAGFSDAGKFRTVALDDPSHELSKELKKKPINESRIVKLALSSLGRTYPSEVLKPPKPPADEPPPISSQDLRQRRLDSWVPTLTVIPATPQWTGWLPLGLGMLALLTGAGLWTMLGRRHWLPEPRTGESRPGPPRAFLQPAPLPGPQFLDTRQQETLVWGIGRFMAEEPTRRLDLTATVSATARAGGVPALRFQPAWQQREVWLWLDEAAEDSTLARLAAEVEAILKVYGLAVERAAFRGIPERLATTTGGVFAPREIDERRDAALVAVLTDGRILTRQYAADDRRVQIDALLRGLSHWPRLAFVDFSEGANALAGILGRHNLERITPTELATFLGGAGPVTAPQRYPQRDDMAWAGVCALAPASLNEVTALALRRQLNLHTSPWTLRALHSERAELNPFHTFVILSLEKTAAYVLP